MNEKFIIYNLEFPSRIFELVLDGYVINRLPEYRDRHSEMMWLVNSSGSEFDTIKKTGSHQATSCVLEINKPSVLPWKNSSNMTRLHDICLFLSLFTERNVFPIELEIYNNNPVLISDHRIYNYGGILNCSIPYKSQFFDYYTNKPLTEKECEKVEPWNRYEGNIGFANGINKILKLTSTTDWLKKYGEGYFLFLFKQAMQRMDVEPTFILCWAIWEHLYSVVNPQNKSLEQLKKFEAKQKITYFLINFFGLKLNRHSHDELLRITKARDNLLHSGKKPKNVDFPEMELFIRATECLVCKILELTPSNVFDTNDRLSKFLKL